MRSLSLLSAAAAAAAVLLLLAIQTAQAQQNVAVDFFVMSKCPDAVFCEQTFAAGLAPVMSIVALSLNYIANETARNSGQFVCRHGPGECTGDMQQLCAKELDTTAPADGQLPVWLQFVLCQSNSSASIPDNAQSCAEQVGLDWSNLQYCVATNGPELLAASSQRRQPGNVNESISCTVELDRKFWCQHNGQWVGCSEGNTADDLTAAICDRYTGATKKPIACEPVSAGRVEDEDTTETQTQEQEPATEVSLAESLIDRANAQAAEAQV